MHISEMQERMEKMSFVFLDNGASSYCVKFSMFRREYLSSVVNVLTNNFKISDQTKSDFVLLNLLLIHQKRGY